MSRESVTVLNCLKPQAENLYSSLILRPRVKDYRLNESVVQMRTAPNLIAALVRLIHLLREMLKPL